VPGGDDFAGQQKFAPDIATSGVSYGLLANINLQCPISVDNINCHEERIRNMTKRTTRRILLSGVFLAWVLVAIGAMAQTMPQHPAVPGATTQTQPKTSQNSAAEKNPACQRIVEECKKLGFIPGQWKKDNGLWKDCFDPVVNGQGKATRDGKPIDVPASQSDIEACRAAQGHKKGAQ
jgi:hypothetical protein